jgi:hypothetical protein
MEKVNRFIEVEAAKDMTMILHKLTRVLGKWFPHKFLISKSYEVNHSREMLSLLSFLTKED